MPEPHLTDADLRAAVEAGHISEAQAAGLIALAQSRAGERDGVRKLDEPFELYRGFNEVFVSVGVVLFLVGLTSFLPVDVGSGIRSADLPVTPGAMILWLVVVFAVNWGLAEYFTRRRRMVAPSIVLVGFLAYDVGTIGGFVLSGEGLFESESGALAAAAVGAAAAAAFYLRFRLPFALFVLGVCLLLAGLLAVGLADETAFDRVRRDGLGVLVDLGSGTVLPLVTLVFGLAAFALAMGFDLRDPHRVTRFAACGFWLHLLAAPAIVNTAAFTLYESGGALATLALVAFLAAMVVAALAIDRRSFLLSGVGYVAALMLLGLGDHSIAVVLVILGALILGLGAGWTGLRRRLMQALPAFPGKHRLPPYAEAP